MTSRDRVLAALRGEAVDRPPVAFWGHVYHRESSAEDLVAHTLERWERFEWDWVKLNPRKHYHVEPWGVRYEYPGVPDEKPRPAAYPVHAPEDWERIGEVSHDKGALGEQIEAVRMLRARLPREVPLLQTVFTPLAILAEVTEPPSRLREHMRTHAPSVRTALETVTRVFERTVRAYRDAGADGLYLATVDWGCRAFMDADALREWSRPYDLRLLAAFGESPYHTLHVCKDQALLFEFADYPVGAFSWDASLPDNPSLAEALARLPGAVMGGIDHDGSLQDATPTRVLERYRRALAETGGRRWLVAPGCSMSPRTPEANLRALRDAVASASVPE